MKKYVDADRLIKATIEVPKELWELELLMREKPNFDKNQGARKIFQRKEYCIYRVKNGFIVHNINKRFQEGHTHVHNYHKAKSLIDLAVRKKLPNTPRKWEIQSLIRITNNTNYKNKLMNLYQTLL